MSSRAVPMTILIMTATITPPPDAPGMNRMDPAVRLQDYKLALDHYLKLVGTVLDAIVFVENSCSDVGALKDLVARAGIRSKVEFLAFDGMDKPSNYGRCYGEARILDWAMSESAIIRQAPAESICFKVTGRYKILNFPTLRNSLPRRFDFYCDLRSFGGPWADMRFMAWNKTGYDGFLKNIAEEIREDTNRGRPGEETLHGVLQRRSGNAVAVFSFRREPLIDGVRGFDNANWNQGKRKLVYRFRDLQRIFFRRVFA